MERIKKVMKQIMRIDSLTVKEKFFDFNKNGSCDVVDNKWSGSLEFCT
tara:strand:+ start:542 stop:685 length:144 start_codon:yes stop_codon:yes gene_type:complete